ncbi:MAG: conjugal transfer protein TraG N-terminal domain-containing protein [Deltaproteobacteria bacterium]|nr:conjugal transfer protein TraG N-terminal domain-containing protein [Deltaproteobacteria bacterium]
MNTWDFYTYGGFDIIVTALNSIALMFSDNNFTGLYWAFAAFTLLIYFTATWTKALFGGIAMGIIEWGKTFFLAIILWVGLIAPVGTLIVYDAQTNKMQSIGNLPIGVVVVAGITNMVQRGFVDIVETATAPLVSYKDGSGGKGLDMFSKLYNFVSNDMIWPDQYNKASLDRYINDCLFFYMATGNISANDFLKSSNLFSDVLSQGQSEGVYTVYYAGDTVTNRAGVTMTCTASYTALQGMLTTAYFTSILQGQFCPKTGYSRDDPQQVTQCVDTFTNHLDKMAGYVNDGAQSILQMYIAQYVNNYVKSGDTSAIANFVAARETGSGMMGVGFIANDFVPIFINVMTAIAILSTPLLFLFFATNALQALSYYVGTFLWLLIWAVADAMLHYFAMNYAYNFYAAMRDNPMAYVSLFTFDTGASKLLALLGGIRVLGMMLAGSIAFGILKFGGESFSRMASSLEGKVDSAGSHAGKVALKPEEQGAYYDSFYSGIGRREAINNSNPHDIMSEAWAGRIRDINSVKAGMGASGLNPQDYGAFIGGIQGAKNYGADLDQYLEASQLGLVEDSNKDGKFDDLEVASGIRDLEQFHKSGNTLTWGMADKMNRKSGTDAFREGQKITYGKDPQTGAIRNISAEENATGVEVNGKAMEGAYAVKKTGSIGPDGKTTWSDTHITGSDQHGSQDFHINPNTGRQSGGVMVDNAGRHEVKGQETIHAAVSDGLTSVAKTNTATGDFLENHITGTKDGLPYNVHTNKPGLGTNKDDIIFGEWGEKNEYGGTSDIKMDSGGNVTETMTLGKDGIDKFAKDANNGKLGHGITGDYVAKELAPRIKQGEGVEIVTQKNKNGDVVGNKIKHGSGVDHYDNVNKKWGKDLENWNGKYGGLDILGRRNIRSRAMM